MGWLFTAGATRGDIIRDVTRTDIQSNGRRLVTCRRKLVGSTLWTVQQWQEADGTPLAPPCIVAYLIRRDKDGAGYKDVAECMGPYEVNCPLSFLDAAPLPDPDHSGYAADWRRRVRAYHATRNQRLTIGQRVRLREGCQPREVEICSLKPLKGYGPNGILYRVARKHLAPVATV